MSTVRSAPLPRDDFATAEMHAAAAESRVVTVENLCGHSPVEEEEAQALVKSAALVYVGDDAFSVEAFKCTFAAAEDAAAVPECARKYTRAVVMWLLGIALDNGNTPMPGAAIGGRSSRRRRGPVSGPSTSCSFSSASRASSPARRRTSSPW